MRRAWAVVVLGLLIGCGASPNDPAIQTRTADAVELTVAARTLPTANAAIPPTPVPATATPRVEAPTAPPFVTATSGPPRNLIATETVRPVPTPIPPIPIPFVSTPPAIPRVDPPTFPPSFSATHAALGTEISAPFSTRTKPAILAGSWVAFSSAIHVRFFAPPTLIEAPEFTSGERYSLASPSNIYDFEALDVYRFVGATGGNFAQVWERELANRAKSPSVTNLTKSSGPRQQQVGAYQGNVGQFHYDQTSNGLPVSGTMWVGQVGGDEVMVVYRCAPAREQMLDQEFAQILATIDFLAR